MKWQGTKGGTISGLALATALWSGAALAQDPAAAAPDQTAATPSQSAPVDDSVESTGDIVVTAQFTRQSQQRTPIAITAVTGEMIEARNQASVIDVATRAPNVTLTNAGATFGNAATASIRGIGQFDPSFALEPGVGIYIDDIYYGVLFGSSLDVLDLDRVEVLRGPQGTLAGKNSIGGAVKLFSQLPKGDDRGYVEAGYGSYDRVNLKAAADIALVPDTLFVRLSGLSRHSRGYLTDYDYGCRNPGSGVPALATTSNCRLGREGGQRINAGRAALRWLVTDGVEDNLIASISDDRSDIPAQKLIYANNPNFSINGVPYDSRFVTGTHSYSSYSNFVGPNGFRPTRRSTARVFTLSNSFTARLTDDLNLTSITGYIHSSGHNGVDNDASPVDIQESLNTERYRQFTQELRLGGSLFADHFDWTLGGFYFNSSGVQGGRLALTSSGLDFSERDPVRTRSASAFAHGVYRVTDKLSVVGGLRYTHDNKRYTFNRLNPDGSVPSCVVLFPGCTPNFNLIGLQDVTGRYRGNRTDYRIGANYQWTPAVMTYAQVSTGFKGGGINPRPYFPSQVRNFGPETLTAYEVGAKSQWFDRRLRLNVALFRNSYKDIQQTLLSCDAFSPFPGAPCSLPVNAGDAIVQGVELEGEVRPFASFSIDGSFSTLDFDYKRLAAGTGITKNMTSPYSPKYKANLGAQYALPIGGGSLTPRVDWIYQSSLYTNAVNDPFNRVAGHGIFNARLSYSDASDKWTVAVSATNLFDKFYYVNVQDSHEAVRGGYVTGQPGRPREWLITLRRRFGGS